MGAQEGAALPSSAPGDPGAANGNAPPANGHAASDAAAEGGPKGAKGGTARRGVAPGSFLDLLMHATDRTTGRGFTDLEIANQARAETRRTLAPLHPWKPWLWCPLPHHQGRH